MFSLNKKKIVVLISATIIVSSLLGTVIVAQGKKGKKWDPFEDIWNAIFGLNNDVDELQTQINEINVLPAGYSIPAYDSGWVEIKFPSDANIINHGLGTTDVLVQVMMKDTDGNIHQKSNYFEWHHLTPNDISVHIKIYDDIGNYGDIRVMLWKIAEP